MPASLPPLSLYVHIPWCIRKCPYCDFNSHARQQNLPVEAYVYALIKDLQQDAHLAQQRRLSSIFFGGGTPSLFPASAFAEIIGAAKKIIGLEKNAEITIEANPGTTELINFADCLNAGINRLSLGVQSFTNSQLSSLGRIHNANQAETAFYMARSEGFKNINLDLMHGLPGQDVEQAMFDLRRALELQPEHISWYQLTIEPNTEFYSRPPSLPSDDSQAEITEAGQELLFKNSYPQYEVSAYAPKNRQAQHNINYWEFGDYLAIGAGAHGKITQRLNHIIRYQKTRLPEHYLDENRSFTSATKPISASQLPMEFLMNALRLKQGVDIELFTNRTGINLKAIEPALKRCQKKGLMPTPLTRLAASDLGYQFLNSLLGEFIT